VFVPSVTLSVGIGLLICPVEWAALEVLSASSMEWGGMFIRVSFVLFRLSDVPARDVACLLDLFRSSSFFFLMFSKIVFCILGSFVVVDCG
jgi:hypothetical protein